MSTGTTIPSYQQACLASDTRNSAVYLIGGASSAVGTLEVNYVSLTNINAPTTQYISKKVDPLTWNAGSPKACYAAPSPNQANTVIKVIQFGLGTSYMTYISPGGAIADPTLFTNIAFKDPKLFGWVGSFTSSNYNIFHVYTAPSSDSSSHWIGLRLSFLGSGSLWKLDTKMFPSVVDPMLSVGTYTPTTLGDSQGYSVIFDNLGKGQVYSATGSDQATLNNTIPVLILSNPGSVNMNGIVLSSDAVSVTMGDTGYILDKAKDSNTTVLYSITPDISSTLQYVTYKGGAPVFFPSIAVTALDKQIVVYSAPPGGTPYFNSFDTTTGTWGGVNLITPPVPIPPDPTLNIGAIVGGIIGGLLVIALLVILFILHRNNQRRNAAAASVTDANADKYAPAPSTGGMTQIPKGGVVVPIQGQVFQGQRQPQQQQQAGFNYQPPILDPYAQVQKPNEPLYVPYQPPTKFFDPYGGNQGNGVPVNYDTTGSQSSPTIFSSSPYASPVPLRTEPEPLNQQQHYSPVQQQQHYSPVQQQQQQQQHYSPAQQQQQQQHFSPMQQQQQHQHQQPILPERPHVQPMAIGVPISAASKSPQFIPQPQ